MQNSGFSDPELSSDLLAEICESFPEALLLLDSHDFTVRFANPTAARLTGYLLPELTGKSIFNLHTPADEPRIRAVLRSVVETHESAVLQVNFVTQLNQPRPVQTRIRLLQNRYLLCISKSCAAGAEEFRRHFDDCPDLKNRMLQMEKMATIGTLVAGVAHEINTPIGALNSNNDTLRRFIARTQKFLDQPEQLSTVAFVQYLKKACNTMAQLNLVSKTALERVILMIQSLRKVARQDSEMVETDINSSLESTLTLVAHYLKGGVEVHKEFGALPQIKCFPSQLNQVFLNLVVNAIQAIPEKGKIIVRTALRDETILVEIRDTGTGIHQENLSQIFDPGFTTKSPDTGTGLGLAIVKDIIERHHGIIQVTSEPGSGTCFQILLPLQK